MLRGTVAIALLQVLDHAAPPIRKASHNPALTFLETSSSFFRRTPEIMDDEKSTDGDPVSRDELSLRVKSIPIYVIARCTHGPSETPAGRP